MTRLVGAAFNVGPRPTKRLRDKPDNFYQRKAHPMTTSSELPNIHINLAEDIERALDDRLDAETDLTGYDDRAVITAEWTEVIGYTENLQPVLAQRRATITVVSDEQ